MNVDETIGLIRERDSFILTSHEFCDADGLGAEYALAVSLKAIGKKARILNEEPPASKFAFMDRRGIVETLDDPPEGLPDPSGALLVIMDTNDTQFIGRMADAYLPRTAGYFMIDHHDPKKNDPATSYLDPQASSTCELVFRIIRAMDIPLEHDVAEALFAGIVYDTGSFIYPKTSAETFHTALELVRAGVQPFVIHNLMYESSSIGVLLLRKKVYSTLELRAGNRIAIQLMTRDDLASSPGASYEDGEDLINMPLHGKDVEVSLLFKQNTDGVLRCSLRSKGLINVAHIAQGFGGGGHGTAAGFKCPLPLELMREKVVETISEILD
ncbi:MAG: DHH family phosphoesterase [Spirochaetes bacterium]|nr:DHH family phosphoesterase [Spirochaetota bacterium]